MHVPRWRRTPGGFAAVPDAFSAMQDEGVAKEGPGVVAGLFTDDDSVRGWIARHAAVLGEQPLGERVLRMLEAARHPTIRAPGAH